MARKFADVTVEQLQAVASYKSEKENSSAPGLKKRFLELREQHLAIAAEQQEIADKLHAEGDRLNAMREALLALEINPKLVS